MLKKNDRFLVDAVARNLPGLTDFIDRLVFHEGDYRATLLHKVDEHLGGTFSVRKGRESEKLNSVCIGMGGEVANSFCPLYEIAYFFQCLFLSGLSTIFLKSGRAAALRETPRHRYVSAIQEALLGLTQEEIFQAISKPSVAIISSLDTDIEPLRYGKHELWRLADEALPRRISALKKADLNQAKLDESLRGTYWVDEDLRIAERAIADAETLNYAKAIQYYATLKRVMALLGIDMKKIPLFFNYVPAEEMRALGPDNEFLEALIGLHTPESRLAMRAITGRSDPWVLTIPCEKCGQSSKRVLKTVMRADGRTVRVRCKEGEKVFRNEMGRTYLQHGCGHTFEFTVPDTPAELYRFCLQHDFSIYYPARQLIAIIKTSIDTPICVPVTDVGVMRNPEGRLVLNHDHPKGFGDHLDMITSALAMEHYFIHGTLAPDVSARLKRKNVLMPHPLMIPGFDGPSVLVDRQVNVLGREVPVTDTSVLKALEHGASVEDMFIRSLWFYHFQLGELLSLRATSNNSFAAIAHFMECQKRSA